MVCQRGEGERLGGVADIDLVVGLPFRCIDHAGPDHVLEGGEHRGDLCPRSQVHHLSITVRHDDREIEINQCARWLRGFFPSLAKTPATRASLADFGPQSCEQLAKAVIHAACDRYGADRAITCIVLEDGLQGATVIWTPDPTASQDQATTAIESELLRA
ncbi:hypothetical protein [Kutzneria sp. NPDC052558]|uniref:hypothetical protein n=1 Tax=Kutzneria sp. NPDC052558 TaxID=3364121 RepID=UPI0037CC6BBF